MDSGVWLGAWGPKMDQGPFIKTAIESHGKLRIAKDS
jgi:hypothetical protein